MSESLEIPDEAVEAGVEAWATAGSIASVQIRAALVAARPYLMPAVDLNSTGVRDAVGAEVFRGLHGNGTVHFDTDVENNAMRDWTNYFVKSTLRALALLNGEIKKGEDR